MVLVSTKIKKYFPNPQKNIQNQNTNHTKSIKIHPKSILGASWRGLGAILGPKGQQILQKSMQAETGDHAGRNESALLGGMLGAKIDQNRSKIDKVGPSWLQVGPSWPQVGSKSAQVGPGWPKLVPRWRKLVQVGCKLASTGLSWSENVQIGC